MSEYTCKIVNKIHMQAIGMANFTPVERSLAHDSDWFVSRVHLPFVEVCNNL